MKQGKGSVGIFAQDTEHLILLGNEIHDCAFGLSVDVTKSVMQFNKFYENSSQPIHVLGTNDMKNMFEVDEKNKMEETNDG